MEHPPTPRDYRPEGSAQLQKAMDDAMIGVVQIMAHEGYDFITDCLLVTRPGIIAQDGRPVLHIFFPPPELAKKSNLASFRPEVAKSPVNRPILRLHPKPEVAE